MVLLLVRLCEVSGGEEGRGGGRKGGGGGGDLHWIDASN